ncbi:MAG: DUF4126 domain-containing protein [Thermoanaerobaculia bacterium]
MTDLISLAGSTLGLGLGAGINAYATFLVFGLISRFFPEMFPGDMAHFFSSTPVLIVVGVLYVVEFVADKIPAVDHAWDVVHTFVRPLAGAVIAFSAASPHFPKGVAVLAAAIGGSAALTSHLAKASLRVASTSTTGGLASPVISLLEDGYAVAQSLLAIFVPFVFLILALLFLIPAAFFVARFRRRRASGPA